MIDQYKLFHVSKKTDTIRDSLLSQIDVEDINDVVYWFEHFSVLELTVFPLNDRWISTL